MIDAMKKYHVISLLLLTLCSFSVLAEVTRIEVESREILGDVEDPISYEAIRGKVFYTLDPSHPANQRIVDIVFAPRNDAGLVEFATDFELFVPQGDVRSDALLYSVNNRGNSSVAPQRSLASPLARRGYTYLVTGWINELAANTERIRLHAPIVSQGEEPITGLVRYEIIVNRPENNVNIAGDGHLAYAPSTRGMGEATLSRRLNQRDPRSNIPREDYSFSIVPVDGSNQVLVNLVLEDGLQPGMIYELIYEAKDPVLAGAGLAAIRDMVSTLRYGSADPDLRAQVDALGIPQIKHSIAYGNSQSGRLLRQYLHQGFNADVDGRQVFDGVVPIIAGAGFGMFNTRFAMPTRTNGQHENFLYPNDYFPFTYGESRDPFSGRSDGILRQSRLSNTEPKVMHIQTSNEYWLRAGSLVHTDPLGLHDAAIPDNVRLYTIGGSQHSPGNGVPGTNRGLGQMLSNPNAWRPIADSLLIAMAEWLSEGTLPPVSRYPKIADGTLVPAHLESGMINPAAWRILPNYAHPQTMYQVGVADFGPNFHSKGIVSMQPMFSNQWYRALVPAVNRDNNDLLQSTILPPLSAAPLGSFVSWNLRRPEAGAPTELARLLGGYIPFAKTAEEAQANADPRPALSKRYSDAQDYLRQYAAATDELIAQGYLLGEYRQALLQIARRNLPVLQE